MTTIERIKTFLATTRDVSLGFSEINFCAPDALSNQQIGYSVDENGNSLLTGDDGGWLREWLVVANDDMGDPIIIDTNTAGLTVLSAVHGDDLWEPYIIADNLENFNNIILLLANVSLGRTNPVDLEQNPVPEKEQHAILSRISKENSNAELWYWEAFFETD